MKTEKSLQSAAESRRKQSIKTLSSLKNLLTGIQDGNHGYFAAVMPRVRKELSDLNQCVHEYNAYRNALETE